MLTACTACIHSRVRCQLLSMKDELLLFRRCWSSLFPLWRRRRTFKVETEGLFSDLCPEFIGPRSRDDLLTIVSFVARPTWQPRMPWGPDQGPARAASGDTCSCQSPLWRPHRTSPCPSGRGRSLLQLLFWGRHLTLEWPGHMWCWAPLIYYEEGSYFPGEAGEKEHRTNQ